MNRAQAERVRMGDSVRSHHGVLEVVAIRVGPSGGIQFRLKYGGWVKARYCEPWEPRRVRHVTAQTGPPPRV